MGKTKIATIDDSEAQGSKATKGAKIKDQLSVPGSQSSDESQPVVSESVFETEKPTRFVGASARRETDQPGSENRPASPELPLRQVEDEASQRGEKQKTDNRSKSSKASKKKGKVKYRSAKYKEALGKVEKSKRYPVTEAIDLAKQSSYSKFDGSLEMHLSTNAKNIRGLVSLPFASGKKLKILAFGPTSLKASEGQEKELEELGAEIGDNAKLEEIIRGKTGFDVIVTTPEWMPKLARAAKVLGPRGLMPSPKNGTITNDLKKAVTEIQSGKVEYKTEKNGQAIHLTLGKVSQKTDEVAANTKILFNAIGKTRVKKVVIAPSMGIGVKIDLNSI